MLCPRRLVLSPQISPRRLQLMKLLSRPVDALSPQITSPQITLSPQITQIISRCSVPADSSMLCPRRFGPRRFVPADSSMLCPRRFPPRRFPCPRRFPRRLRLIRHHGSLIGFFQRRPSRSDDHPQQCRRRHHRHDREPPLSSLPLCSVPLCSVPLCSISLGPDRLNGHTNLRIHRRRDDRSLRLDQPP